MKGRDFMLKVLCAFLLLPIALVLLIVGGILVVGGIGMLLCADWIVGIIMVVAVIVFIMKRFKKKK